MVRRPEFSRGYETRRDGDGKVHADGPPLIGTSLCGITDGVDWTADPINCVACLAMIDFIHAHRRPATPISANEESE